jgi:hypothetical protein
MTERRDERDAPPPGGPQRADRPGPSLGKVRDTDGAGHTDAPDPEATEPVGDATAEHEDQEVQR